MKKSMAVLISGGVTAVVLALAGGLAVQAGIIETASASSDAQPAPTATAGVDFAPREAQYRALIEEANRRLLVADQRIAEANQRIEQANQRIRDLEQQVQPAQQQQTQPAGDQAQMISPDDAATIGLQAVRGAVLLETPSLVGLNGQTLYKVALDAGTLYLDPSTGAILYAVRAEH